MKIEGRVRKGIAFLDKKFGRKSWAKKIKPNVLDLGDNKKCMIGEVMGGYDQLEEKFGISSSKAVELGFMAPEGAKDCFEQDEDKKTMQYSVLTSVWMCALKQLGIRK